MSSNAPHAHRLGVVLREGEIVGPLELFFDLVFVLAITQCTSLMADGTTWRTLGQGLVVLGLLWWAWVGYAWLTSVVDPDHGGVRLVVFAAMAALLVTSLCVPDAFGDTAMTFAVAYSSVRAAQIVLFVLASRGDAGLRHSVLGLAMSTALGSAMLIAGAVVDGDARLATWSAALLFDMAGPLFIDTSGWRLVPQHFAERHGLIVIVALGESIVAIGVGADARVGAAVIGAAILGIGLACAMWWAYFDVASVAAARRLRQVDDVVARNEMARDAYSYIHLPMVAAVVLVALGMKTTLHRVDEPLSWVAATGLVGGAALYLLAQVAFKVRTLGTTSVGRLVAAAACLALLPLAPEVDAIVTVALTNAVVWSVLAFETVRFAESRHEIRHAVDGE